MQNRQTCQSSASTFRLVLVFRIVRSSFCSQRWRPVAVRRHPWWGAASDGQQRVEVAFETGTQFCRASFGTDQISPFSTSKQSC